MTGFISCQPPPCVSQKLYMYTTECNIYPLLDETKEGHEQENERIWWVDGYMNYLNHTHVSRLLLISWAYASRFNLNTEMKEVKMSYKINDHDYQVTGCVDLIYTIPPNNIRAVSPSHIFYTLYFNQPLSFSFHFTLPAFEL